MVGHLEEGQVKFAAKAFMKQYLKIKQENLKLTDSAFTDVCVTADSHILVVELSSPPITF